MKSKLTELSRKSARTHVVLLQQKRKQKLKQRNEDAVTGKPSGVFLGVPY